MGEIAEMMLEGWFCQGCGDLMCDPTEGPQGYPGFCSAECAGDQPFGDDDDDDDVETRTCHVCRKVCKTKDGVIQHLNAKHPGWIEALDRELGK